MRLHAVVDNENLKWGPIFGASEKGPIFGGRKKKPRYLSPAYQMICILPVARSTALHIITFYNFSSLYSNLISFLFLIIVFSKKINQNILVPRKSISIESISSIHTTYIAYNT